MITILATRGLKSLFYFNKEMVLIFSNIALYRVHLNTNLVSYPFHEVFRKDDKRAASVYLSVCQTVALIPKPARRGNGE
jgi:hypothetical protein